MASLSERAGALVASRRRDWPWLDHLLRMLSHYGSVGGAAQAGAVTFFGFLSFFPILAIAFFVVGLVAHVHPAARADLVREIDDLLPGLIGEGQGRISLTTIERYAATIGAIGIVTVLYAGLGWLSGMRDALEVMFCVPRRDRPNLVIGKLRDLRTLALVGVVLLLSVVLSGAVTGFSATILDAVGVDARSVPATVGLNVLARVLAIAASVALLLLLFRLLVPESGVPGRARLSGALLGAVGFEVLKVGANLLLGHSKGQPAFQAFGVALVLLIWINYFSRLVMYAAAWAYTAPEAVAGRTAEAVIAPGAALPEPDEAVTPASAPSAAPSAALSGVPRTRPPWGLVAATAAVAAVVGFVARGELD